MKKEEVLKQRILEATIDEFHDKGFRFTMDDLAKRLSISKKTIYTIVKDKETLFWEMVDSCFEAIKESEQEILSDGTLEITEKIQQILIVLPDRYQHIDFRQIYEMKDKYPLIFQKIKDRIEQDWEPTIQLLEQAMEEGKIRQVPIPVIKIMVESTIEGFLSSKELIDCEISYKEALERMLDLLMNGLLVKTEKDIE